MATRRLLDPTAASCGQVCLPKANTPLIDGGSDPFWPPENGSPSFFFSLMARNYTGGGSVSSVVPDGHTFAPSKEEEAGRGHPRGERPVNYTDYHVSRQVAVCQNDGQLPFELPRFSDKCTLECLNGGKIEDGLCHCRCGYGFSGERSVIVLLLQSSCPFRCELLTKRAQFTDSTCGVIDAEDRGHVALSSYPSERRKDTFCQWLIRVSSHQIGGRRRSDFIAKVPT